MSTFSHVRPGAEASWSNLGGVLADLADRGTKVPCWSQPEPFTSDDPGDRAQAAAACLPCPALIACRRFADDNGERFNVWAGVDRSSVGGGR